MNYKSGIIQRGRPAVLPYLYCSLLLGLFAILWSATFAKHLVAAEDGATYYILGKALYLGEGYISINTPVAIPANNPPPGYPLLVALTMALWSAGFVAIKVVNKVNYVVLDRLGYGSTGRYLVPAVTKYVDDFFLVRKLENPPTWLLEFHPSD